MLLQWTAFLTLYATLAVSINTTNSNGNSTTSFLTTTPRPIGSSKLSQLTNSSNVVTSSSSSPQSKHGLGSFILQGLGATSSGPSGASLPSDVPVTSDSPLLSSSNISNATSNTRATVSPTSSSNSSFDLESCSAASISWRSAHANDSIPTESTSIWTTTYTSQTYVRPSGTAFTLCDRYPRMHGKPSNVISTSTEILTSVTVNTLSAQCTSGCPSCNIGAKECSRLWSSWDTNTVIEQSTGDSPACPSPTRSSNLCPNFMPGPPDCFFTAGPVRLVYFSPEIKGNRLCGNYTTMQPPNNRTTPVTVQTLGTTFTSGTAYISFASLAAVDTCGIAIGTPTTDLFIPLPSSEVSSMCGDNNGVFITGPRSTAVNYADLQTPIASDVYKCQPNCLWGGMMWTAQCPTIYDDYAPALAYPTQVKQLQPEWNECWFKDDEYFRYQYGQKYYLFDPPLALTKATAEAGITLPASTSGPTKQPPAAVSKATVETSPTILLPIDTSSKALAGGPESDPAITHTSLETHTDGAPATEFSPDPGGALSVLTHALGTAPGSVGLPASNDETDAANTNAPANPSLPPNAPVGHARPTLNQDGGLIVGNSVTVQLSQGGQASLDLSGNDLVTATRDKSNYIIAGQTLTPGQVAEIQGQEISAMPLQTDEGDGTPTSFADFVSTFDVSRLGSSYVVNGALLKPGQATTVNGQALSLDLEGDAIAFGSSTLSLDPGAATIITAASDPTPELTISRSGTDYVVDGTTMTPGYGTFIDGEIVSVLKDVDGLVAGSRTTSLADGEVATVTPATGGPIDVDMSRSGSIVVFDRLSLMPGEQTTIDGQMISILSDGEGAVVESSTVSLSDGQTTTVTLVTSPLPEAVVFIGSKTLTAYGVAGKPDEIVLDGKTLTVARTALTIDGEILSLGSGGLIGIEQGQTSILALTGATAMTSREATTAAGSPSQPSSPTSGALRLASRWVVFMILGVLTAVVSAM